MAGYDPGFLGHGITVPLPSYNPQLTGFVLNKEGLENGGFTADYPNYSIVTNKKKRSPILAALNVDLDKVEKQATKRKSSWNIDTRIGAEFQLSNEYYADRDGEENLLDKGHLAPRETAGWGATETEAQVAANETFYYSNAALQHRYFNGHEWSSLESWVRSLNEEALGGVLNDLVSTFTGPIYGAFPRIKRLEGVDFAAEVPAGFFKVISYIGTDMELHVRAFMLLQDPDAIVRAADRPFKFKLQNYQVTISEIEELTGLKFPDIVREKNPLRYGETTENLILKEELGISSLPERNEVSSPADIQDEAPRPDLFMDETKNVFVAAAMPNPAGTDRGNEWVSVISFEQEEVDLTGWWISDTKNEKKIEELVPEADRRKLSAGDAVSIPLKGGSGGLRLVNTGGAIILYERSFDDEDRRGHRIDRVSYRGDQVTAGRPIVFSTRPEQAV